MSTSELQHYTSEQLHKRFGKYGLVENRRPRWLVSSKGERLELDFFIDKLSIAVEVQGRQHIEFTPLFHITEHDFTEQLRRDKEKKDLCDKAGICLFYVYKKSDVEIVLYETHTKIESTLNNDRDEEFLLPGHADYINPISHIYHTEKTSHIERGQHSNPRNPQERVPGKIRQLQIFLDNETPSKVYKEQTMKRMERLNRRVASGEIVLQDEQAAVIQKVNRRISMTTSLGPVGC